MIATGALLLVGLPLPASAQLPCTGDCNRDHTVAIHEVLTGVAVSLGTAAVSSCYDFDRDADARVSVDELVAGIANALDGCAPQAQAFAATSDFFSGSFGTVALDEPRTVTPSSPRRRIYRDAVVRAFGGLVYVVNRLFADNVQVLDPGRDFATRIQCSTGNGTNPHDIAFVNARKAYVTRYEEPDLLIVNPSAAPTCRDFVLGAVDLSPLADGDGIPDMDQMVLVGSRLYVALQRLDLNTVLRLPAGRGVLAIVDTETDQLAGSIELSGENPFGATKGLTVRGRALYVAEAGLFGVLDGGIERIDLDTEQAAGFFITEADLGGDVTDFAFVSDRRAYAIINRPTFTTALVAFDPSTGAVLDTVTTGDGFTFADIEVTDRGELFLADRARRRPGLRLFRAADGAPLTNGALDLVLPPFEVVFIP